MGLHAPDALDRRTGHRITERAHEKPTMKAEAYERVPRRKTIRILLVEGERKVAERLATGLSGTAGGMELVVSVVGDLAAANTLLLSEAVDIVLVDLSIPGASDADILDQVTRWSRMFPVVVLAGLGRDDLASRAVARGATESVSKESLDPSSIAPLIRQIARSRKLELELRGKIEEARTFIHHYQGILRNTPDGLCHLDNTWQILVTNHTMKRIFDPHLRLTEEVYGRSFGDLFGSPAEFIRYRRQAEESIETTGTDRQEVELQRWDGTRVSAQVSLCYLDSVRPESGFVATIADITEHKRLREALQYKEELEKLTQEVSSRFISLNSPTLESDLHLALGRLGRFLEVDRCYLVHFQGKGVWPPSVFEWTAEGIDSAFSALKEESPESLGWTLDGIPRDSPIQIRSIVTLDSSLPEREFLIAHSVRSYLAVPLCRDNVCSGCIGFHSVRREKAWPEETIAQVRFLGLVFLNALTHRDAANSLTRLSNVVEQTADSVVITDTHGTIEYVNPAFVEKTGYTAEEAVGDNPRILRSGVHGRAFYDNLWGALRSGKPYKGVIVNRRKNGELYHEAQTITPIRDSEGVIRNYVSTAKDITEQIVAENKLRESEKRYRGLVESQHDMIVRISPEGRFTFVNDAFCREFGVRPGEPIERDFFEFIHPEDLDETRDALRALSTPPYRIRLECRSHSTRSDQWLEWEMYGIRDADEAVAEIQAVGRDITEKHRLEAEREVLQRLTHHLTLRVTLNQVARILAFESRRLFAHDSMWLSLYDEAHNTLSGIYLEDTPEGDPSPREISFEKTIFIQRSYSLYSTKRPVLINRMEPQEFTELVPFGFKERLSRSLMFAPILWEDRIIAVLSVQSYVPGRYTERDLRLLETLAEQCGGVVARLRTEEEREALQRLSQQLTTVRSSRDLGIALARESKALIGYDSFEFGLCDPDRARLTQIYVEDTVEGQSAPGEQPVESIELSKAENSLYAEGAPGLINDIGEEMARDFHRFGDKTHMPRSILYAPVSWNNRIVAVLSVRSYSPRKYTTRELHLLQAFADQCGGTIARVWASDALARETATLNHIIEYNPYAILLTDPNGRPVKTNPAYIELLGAPPPPSYSLFTDPVYEKQDLCTLIRRVREGETVSVPDTWHTMTRGEIDGQTADEETSRRICLRTVVFPITGAGGQTENFVVMHQDITARMRAEQERQKLYEELIEKERLAAMGQTIAEVAHCMKNIFTAVNGGIYLLEQSLKLNRWDLTQRSYQTLRQSSTRLYLFLMNMLDFSKKREGVREEVSVQSILDDVVRMLQASADSRNVGVVTRVEQSAEVFRLDSQGLFRTLLNLGLNSIDAMPKGGTLEFVAAVRKRTDLLPPLPDVNPPEDGNPARNGESVGIVDVIDTGSGIPAEILSQVFEPFYSTKGSRGTGLGLSSARKFIQEQGGEIRVASEPGKGTRFQLVFPL